MIASALECMKWMHIPQLSACYVAIDDEEISTSIDGDVNTMSRGFRKRTETTLVLRG